MPKLKSLLSMILIAVLLCSLFPAVAESNYFTLYNYTGQSISELYLYPANNSKFGNPRNTKGYVYDQSYVKVSVNSSELRLNCEWCLRITLRNGRYSTHYTWDSLDLNDLVGYDLNLTFTSDGHLSLDYVNSSGTTNSLERTVKITNCTGEAISEVYVYPCNNSRWGNSRTNKWIYNYDSETFVMNSQEISVNTLWNITICFRSGRRSFSVTWEEWDIDSIIGNELMIYKSGTNTYTMEYNPLNGRV